MECAPVPLQPVKAPSDAVRLHAARSRKDGLACISALSMLPVYHRTGDAKLLLLSVPACALLWTQGGRLGRVAFAITFIAFIANADLSWIFAIAVLNHYPGPNVGFASELRTAAQIFPAPLSLLAMSVFYLWVYIRRTEETVQTRESDHLSTLPV